MHEPICWSHWPRYSHASRNHPIMRAAQRLPSHLFLQADGVDPAPDLSTGIASFPYLAPLGGPALAGKWDHRPDVNDQIYCVGDAMSTSRCLAAGSLWAAGLACRGVLNTNDLRHPWRVGGGAEGGGCGLVVGTSRTHFQLSACTYQKRDSDFFQQPYS